MRTEYDPRGEGGEVFTTKTHFLSSHSLLPLASPRCTRYTYPPEEHHGKMASGYQRDPIYVLMNSRLLPLSPPLRLVVLCLSGKVVSSVHQDVSLSFQIRVMPVVSDDSPQSLRRLNPPLYLLSAPPPSSSTFAPYPLLPSHHSAVVPISLSSLGASKNRLTSATLNTTLPTIPFSFLPHPPSPSFF